MVPHVEYTVVRYFIRQNSLSHVNTKFFQTYWHVDARSIAADSIPPLFTPAANIVGMFDDIAISSPGEMVPFHLKDR